MNRAFRSLLAAALIMPLPLLAGDTKSANSSAMTPQTRLAVMRDLTAERVFVRTIFPRGEKGLELKNGKVTPDSQDVAKLVTEHGFAARPGDRVVISNVIIKEKSIVLEINGGGKKHEKWYQHVSVGMGGGATVTPGGAQKSLEATGSTLTLQFDKYVPEMTGNELRDLLAPVFDFKALTQAEAYQKALPPKVQEAIKNHQVLVGMDREMVVYAKGRAPKKVRDKDDGGIEYEEWIYGNPPEEVDFVRFTGPVVTRLEIMTVDGEKIVRTKKEIELDSRETEVAQKKDEPKPQNAPTLRRPGEVDDSQTGPTINRGGSSYPPNTPLPPISTAPTPPTPGGGSSSPN